MTKKDPRKLILEVLRKHPEGLTIVSIAKMTNLHRHTSTKYIHELIGADMVFQRSVGVAKLCYLNTKLSKTADEEKMLKTLEKRRGESKYRMNAIVIAVILTFLMSGTAIWAYQNVSLLNETNFSEIPLINTSPLTSSVISNVSPQISEIINQTFLNGSSEGNETSSIIQPLENVTENVTETVENYENATNDSIQPVLEDAQKFSISLNYPQKITRGEAIELEARTENVGSLPAENVKLEWILPEGFVIDYGEGIKDCGLVDVSGYCTAKISVKTDLSTLLGLREIKIVVHYEE